MSLLRNNQQYQSQQQQGGQIQQHPQQPQHPQLQHHPVMQPMNPPSHQTTPSINLNQQNPLQNMSINPQNGQLNPQQLEYLLRTNPAAANQTPFFPQQQQPQQAQLPRRMAISADRPDIARQYQMLSAGEGIRPHQSRAAMMPHQPPGQPPQQRLSMLGPQMAGMPVQNPAQNMMPPQQQHPFTSPNLTANGVAPQRGPSPQTNFGNGQNQHTQQMSYEQLMMRLKHMQNEVQLMEQDLQTMSHRRPEAAGQLADEFAKLGKKKQQVDALMKFKHIMEANSQGYRQK